MNYEQKYKKALERAKKLYEQGTITESLSYVFPELKESEDDRMILAIKQMYSFLPNKPEYIGIVAVKDIFTWLEKQSQKTYQTPQWMIDFLDKNRGKFASLMGDYDEQRETEGKLLAIIAWLEKQGNTNENISNDELAQGILRGAAINLITWIDYNAAEGNMCLSNMECKDIEDALVSGDWNKIYAYIKKKLEKQGEKPKKVSIWKHWKDGIAGNGEGEQIFLTRIGSVYSISSCLGCECDYIELSELDSLLRDKQASKPKWTEEDKDNLNMAIYFMRSENTPYSPTDVEPVVEWLCGLKQRMEE